MKKLLLLFIPFTLLAQPSTEWREATQDQTDAGVLGAPVVITPRRLQGWSGGRSYTPPITTNCEVVVVDYGLGTAATNGLVVWNAGRESMNGTYIYAGFGVWTNIANEDLVVTAFSMGSESLLEGYYTNTIVPHEVFGTNWVSFQTLGTNPPPFTTTTNWAYVTNCTYTTNLTINGTVAGNYFEGNGAGLTNVPQAGVQFNTNVNHLINASTIYFLVDDGLATVSMGPPGQLYSWNAEGGFYRDANERSGLSPADAIGSGFLALYQVKLKNAAGVLRSNEMVLVDAGGKITSSTNLTTDGINIVSKGAITAGTINSDTNNVGQGNFTTATFANTVGNGSGFTNLQQRAFSYSVVLPTSNNTNFIVGTNFPVYATIYGTNRVNFQHTTNFPGIATAIEIIATASTAVSCPTNWHFLGDTNGVTVANQKWNFTVASGTRAYMSVGNHGSANSDSRFAISLEK